MITRNIILLLALLLAGCQKMPALPSIVAPYRIDIQQGNAITQEMVDKLQPGMSRSQVRFALGTPLVVDPFRTDRWDYVFLYQVAGVVTEQRRIAVFFDGDKLLRIEGDVVPAGSASAAGAKTGKPAAAGKAAPVPPATPATTGPAGSPGKPAAEKPPG